MATYQETKSRLIAEAAKKRIPIVGEFELTTQCDFACKMCYLCDKSAVSGLDTETWKQVFREASEAGLLYALLTGGECLMRPDFVDLYEMLYDLGTRIHVYTNGYRIPEAVLDAFTKRMPERVSITLYGGSERTYGIVTGVPGALAKVSENIDRLKTRHIPVSLRTIPLRPILLDLDKMLDFVEAKGLLLNYFLYVSPIAANPDVTADWRLDAEELIRFESAIRHRFQESEEEEDFETSGFHLCPALKSSYFMTAEGVMKACALAEEPTLPWQPGKLLETFHELSKRWDGIDTGACSACQYRMSCIGCVARIQAEVAGTGNEDYLKRIAKARRKSHE